MAVIFLFIDGVGLGEESDSNPFQAETYDAFSFMAGANGFFKKTSEVQKEDHVFKAVDATLGVEGLPQSGTGQTTLFTGENAARIIGKHFGPFPHSGIKHLLREQSLFNKVQRTGKKSRFINAYPDIFFRRSKKRNSWSCTTLMTKSAGLPLQELNDVKKGKAVTAGLTQQAWKEALKIEVPVITPETAAVRLVNMAEVTDLVLSEYYLTDKAGHAESYKLAGEVLKIYDRFLGELIDKKRVEDTLVLSSDHGNIEDLSIKTHTLNKVPLFAYGPGASAFQHAESIGDVTPGIIDILTRTYLT